MDYENQFQKRANLKWVQCAILLRNVTLEVCPLYIKTVFSGSSLSSMYNDNPAVLFSSTSVTRLKINEEAE